MDNYYKILGVKNFASVDEVKMGYKKLVKKFHPDLNDGDKFFEEKFKEIQIAYEILSDSSRRDSYDKILKTSIQNTTPNFKTPPKEETKSEENTTAQHKQKTKNTFPSQSMRRESPYVFHKGRIIKRRRF